MLDVTAVQQRLLERAVAGKTRRVFPLAAGAPSMTETALSSSRANIAGFVLPDLRTECS